MIGLAVVLVVLGIVTFFFMPWVGIPAAIIGIVLLGLFLAGFGRRAAKDTTVSDRRV